MYNPEIDRKFRPWKMTENHAWKMTEWKMHTRKKVEKSHRENGRKSTAGK